MGYSASGYGSIDLKRGTHVDEVRSVIEALHEEYRCIDFDLDAYENGQLRIVVFDSNTHWDEKYIFDCFEKLLPYTENGMLKYSGEKNSVWKYVFYPDDGDWEEENASYFDDYSDKKLIDELTKRGYKVEKEVELC